MTDQKLDFSLRISPELYEKIKEQADKEYRSMSQLIREAIRLYLNKIKEGE